MALSRTPHAQGRHLEKLWGTVASMYEDMIASLSDLYILDVISAFRGF